MSSLKKLISFILVLVLMFSIIPCSVFAEGEATISVSSTRSTRGKKATVSVNMANNPGVSVLKLRIGYDDTAFTLTNIADNGIMGNAIIDNSPATLASSPAVLVWEKAVASKQMTANGKMATLTFQVNQNTPNGDYPITVNILDGDAVNTSGYAVNYATVSGIITVSDLMYGDVNDDGKVNSIDAFVLLRYLANWIGYTEINEAAADVNNDGRVSMADGTVLLRHIANWAKYRTLPYSTSDSQSWPNGKITLLVGYEEGSLTANNVVTMVDWLKSKGATVEVKYDKVGGGANLVNELVNAEPDGQTMMLFGNNCISNYYSGVWTVNPTDTSLFRAVASIPQPWPYSGCMVLTKADSPYNNYDELKAYVEAHPGEVTAASIPGKYTDVMLKSFLIQTGLADKVNWVNTTYGDANVSILNGDIKLVMADETTAITRWNIGATDAEVKAIINLRPDNDFSYYPSNTKGLDIIKSVSTLQDVFGAIKAKEINIPNTSCWVVPAGTPDKICAQISAMFDAIDDEAESTDENSFYARVRNNGGTTKYWKLSYDEIVEEYARIAPIIKRVVEMGVNE